MTLIAAFEAIFNTTLDPDAERTYVDIDEPNLDDRPTPSQECDMDRAYQRSHQQIWGHSA